MPEIALEGLSYQAGHDSCSPTIGIEGDDLVSVNGRSVMCIGHHFASHGCDDHGSHEGEVVSGSSIVFVNGRAVGRVGDAVGGACSTNSITNGDSLVMIDG